MLTAYLKKLSTSTTNPLCPVPRVPRSRGTVRRNISKSIQRNPHQFLKRRFNSPTAAFTDKTVNPRADVTHPTRETTNDVSTGVEQVTIFGTEALYRYMWAPTGWGQRQSRLASFVGNYRIYLQLSFDSLKCRY